MWCLPYIKICRVQWTDWPNLDDLKPTTSQVINVVANGVGVMPPFEGVLTTEEIEAVAHYVFNSTNN